MMSKVHGSANFHSRAAINRGEWQEIVTSTCALLLLYFLSLFDDDKYDDVNTKFMFYTHSLYCTSHVAAPERYR